MRRWEGGWCYKCTETVSSHLRRSSSPSLLHLPLTLILMNSHSHAWRVLSLSSAKLGFLFFSPFCFPLLSSCVCLGRQGSDLGLIYLQRKWRGKGRGRRCWRPFRRCIIIPIRRFAMRPINGWRSFRPPWKLGRYVEIGVVIFRFFFLSMFGFSSWLPLFCAERSFLRPFMW